MKKVVVVFICLSLMVLSTNVVNAVELTPRSYGMGGAYTGVANNITTVIYNPAGMGESGTIGLYGSIGVMTSDITKFGDAINSLEYLDGDFSSQSISQIFDSFPDDLSLQGQVFTGSNLKNFGIALNVYDEAQVSKTNNTASLENMANTETILAFSNQIIKPFMNIGAISYGFSFKLQQSDFQKFMINTSNNELTQIEAKGNGFGLDAGMLVKVTNLVKVGINIKDIYTPKYEIKGQKTVDKYVAGNWNPESQDTYSSTISKTDPNLRIGASVTIPVVNVTLAADVDNVSVVDGTSNMTTHLGLEKNIMFNGLSVRAGTYKEEAGPQMYTIGMGLNFMTFHVDTAIGVDETLINNPTLLLSGSFKF